MGGLPKRTTRAEQVRATRLQLLDTAERLFAEQGLHAVSNRQVSTAAGQGNNAAVNYHFGTKSDLVRAIMRRHIEPIEQIRLEVLHEVAESDDPREWVRCLVEPVTTYAASLEQPTWFFRFSAQIMADPARRDAVSEGLMATRALGPVLDGLRKCLPDLDDATRSERSTMTRLLLVHLYAEREGELSSAPATAHEGWSDLSTSLVDALTGLWTASTPAAPSVPTS